MNQSMQIPATSLIERVRVGAAVLAAMAAGTYLLIGLQMVTVLDSPAEQRVFGLLAASAFGLGAVLLLAIKRRLVWVLGALFQAFVILQYFNVASQRTPAFEEWGISLRVIQGLLLLAMIYLIARATRKTNSERS